MVASWEPTEIVIGNTTYALKRGQYATSTRNLTHIWECCSQTATDFLKLLEQKGKIMRIIYSRISVITIIDFDTFQPLNETSSVHKSERKPERKVEQNIERKKYKNNINSSLSSSAEQNLKFCEELKKDELFIEYTSKNSSLSKEIILKLIEIFNKEKCGLQEFHRDFNSFRKHFSNWLNKINQAEKINKILNNNQPNSSKHADKFSARRGTDAKNNKPDDYDTSF